MGGSLQIQLKRYVTGEEIFEGSDKYYLFESIQKKDDKILEKEKKKKKKYLNARKFIEDSVLLKFIFLMILINPLFREISEYFSLDKYIIEEKFKKRSENVMLIVLITMNLFLFIFASASLWKFLIFIVLDAYIFKISYQKYFTVNKN